MLGVDSPIRKSVARHNMSSPTRRAPNPEQRYESPAHPLSAGVGLPYASYHPEAVSPNVVGNPVASHVTAVSESVIVANGEIDNAESKGSASAEQRSEPERERRTGWVREADEGERVRPMIIVS